MSSNSRQVVDDNATLLETFVTKYIFDNGIGVQVVEVVAKELFGQVVVVNGTISEDIASNPRELVAGAMKDIADIGIFGDMRYDIETVIQGAASLEFLVRYARKVNPAVIPPAVIPSDEVVNAALELFHESRQVVSS